MSYLPWALFAMVAYGVSAVLLKLAFRGISVPLVVTTTNIAIVLSGVTWAAFQGSSAFRNVGFNSATAWLVIAAPMVAVSIVTYYRALSLGPASVVMPIFALSSAIAATLAILFLGEPLKATRVLGLLLTIAAIFLLTR